MLHKNLLCLLCWCGLLLAPLSVHAQTPPQYINASTCVYNNNVAGLYVVGPYLYGANGTAYCNLSPPAHNYGEAIPTLNSVSVSGYTGPGGSISSQVCRNTSFAGPAVVECGPVRVSSGNFYDPVTLPPAPQSPPTGYFLLVILNPPFAALSGLEVTWNR